MSATYYDIPLTSQMVENLIEAFMIIARKSNNYEEIENAVEMVNHLNKELFEAQWKENHNYKSHKYMSKGLDDFCKYLKEDKGFSENKIYLYLDDFVKYIKKNNDKVEENYLKVIMRMENDYKNKYEVNYE